MIRNPTAMPGVAAAVLTVSLAVAAPVQVALVENVTGNPAGVEFMDYLESGKVINLGPRDTIILSYLNSCVRETITGGTVTIGAKESDVQLGQVTRTTVRCDAGKALTTRPDFAGALFRAAPSTGTRASDAGVQLIIYGKSPMIELKSPGTLLIERIDRVGERQAVKIGKEQLLQGRFYDCAKQGRALRAGGIYRASMGGEETVFKVDPHAEPGYSPIVGRLMRLTPPS
jgi:hypothetical protein